MYVLSFNIFLHRASYSLPVLKFTLVHNQILAYIAERAVTVVFKLHTNLQRAK